MLLDAHFILFFGILTTQLAEANTLFDSYVLVERAPSSEAAPSEAEQKRDEYIINPKDLKNQEALSKTEANIKSILNVSAIYSYIDQNNVLRCWVVNATEAQIADIGKDEGVRRTMKDCAAFQDWDYQEVRDL